MQCLGLLTASQIADRLDEPPYRVTYIIRKYRLKPVERIGITRLFSQGQVEAIENGLMEFRLGDRND